MMKILRLLIDPFFGRQEVYASAFIIWIILTTLLLLMPFSAENRIAQIPGFDKVVHFILFFVMAWLIVASAYLFKLNWFSPSYFAIMFSGCYSLILELFQGFEPSRTRSFFDFLAGFVGALIAVAFYFLARHFSKDRLLLHICCMGCGVFVSKELQKKYRLTLYFFNPNIYPREEYDKRLQEIRRISRSYRLKVVVGDYNHDEWREFIRGHEDDPERGQRCNICFSLRLESAANFAKRNGYNIFSTTLTVSPHKNAVEISRLANELAVRYKLDYLDRDFKKNDGYQKSVILAKKLGLYRQNYCGCEFSVRKNSCQNKVDF